VKTEVVSIGYQGRTPIELIALLRKHHVEAVIDVRELPLSRRKGFSKTPLSSSLATVGIAYHHLKAAGNPHRKVIVTEANRAACLKLYAKHLSKHPEVLDLVAETCDGRRVAFLCFERAHEECHRAKLLEALTRQASARDAWHVVRVE